MIGSVPSDEPYQRHVRRRYTSTLQGNPTGPAASAVWCLIGIRGLGLTWEAARPDAG